MRVGFVTYGVKNGTATLYKALQDPESRRQQAEKVALLRNRAAVTGVECRRPEYADCWDVYPYNSGVFMCLRLKGADADVVRMKLLDEYGVGTIALGAANLGGCVHMLDRGPDPWGLPSYRGRGA